MKILTSLLLTALFAINPKVKLQSPLEQSARDLFANFVGGRYEAASRDFNDDLRPQITPALLAQVRGDLDAKMGSFQQITSVHPLTENGFRAIELVAKFQKSPVSVRVVFDTRDRVAAVYFNPILPPPVEPALEKVSRALLADLIAGRFDDAGKNFDPTMQQQLTPANLAELNRKIATMYGAFQSVTEVRQRVEKPYRIIEVIAACDKMPLAFRVGFDAMDRIAAVHVSPKTN